MNLQRRLVRLAWRFGAWLLEHLSHLGGRALAAYMEGRALVFVRRAAAGEYPVYNRGRARRWRRVAAWLRRVSQAPLKNACKAARVVAVAENIPAFCEAGPP